MTHEKFNSNKPNFDFYMFHKYIHPHQHPGMSMEDYLYINLTICNEDQETMNISGIGDVNIFV